MDISKLTALLTALVALSIASQRLVDIFKKVCGLDTEKPDATWEKARQIGLQIAAMGAGALTALLAQSAQLLDSALPITNPIVLGILAGGGSDFWNSVLGYVKGVKEIKKAEALDTRVKAAANIVSIAAASAPGVQTTSAETTDKSALQNARTNLERVITIASNNLTRSL